METRPEPESRYRPAPTGWFVVARRDLLLAVPSRTEEVAVARLWTAVHGRLPIAALLELLTVGDVVGASDFVLVELETDAVRVRVLGAETVRFPDVDPAPIPGAGSSPWTEFRVASRSLDVVLEPAEGGQLPLVEGVVRAASIGVSGPPGAVSPGAGVSLGMTVPAPRDEADPAVDDPSELALGAEGLTGRAAPSSPPSAPAGDHAVRVSRAELAAARALRVAQRRGSGAARFWVDLPAGGRAPIAPELLIGRDPSVARPPGERIPLVITLGNQQISRNHALLVAQPGGVVVTDLGSTNGIGLRRPGRPVRQLVAGQRELVEVGTVIDLGNGHEFTVREEV